MNTGAAIGVAFVSAVIALGISLGINFAKVQNAAQGPDLLGILRGMPQDNVPKDIHGECFGGIEEQERPQSGDWIAIWGGERDKNGQGLLLIG